MAGHRSASRRGAERVRQREKDSARSNSTRTGLTDSSAAATCSHRRSARRWFALGSRWRPREDKFNHRGGGWRWVRADVSSRTSSTTEAVVRVGFAWRRREDEFNHGRRFELGSRW